MVTILIIVATCLFSYKGFQDKSFFYKYDLAPYQIKHHKEWYRFISHAFLHADWGHLFFNMFVFFNFGRITNFLFQGELGFTTGIICFLILYFGGIVVASLSSYKKNEDNPNYHSIGASGAVSAVLFSYIIFLPMEDLHIVIIPFIQFPSIVWGVAYLAYEHYQSRKNTGHVNHDAHISGAIFGIVFTIIAVPATIERFFTQIFNF